MGVIGETLATPSEYRYHPPAASAHWSDADPLDSGTAHELDSNLAHLETEGVRPLFWTLGPGVLTKYAGDGYGLRDVGAPSGLIQTHEEISWDRRVATRRGPYVAVLDRDLPDGGVGIRSVKLRIDVKRNGGTTLRAYFALTATPDPPTRGFLAFDSKLSSTTGALEIMEVTLTVATPLHASERMRGRVDGALYADVIAVWAWIGWKSSSTANVVAALSGWETRT
jgi:hypothetical protein